MTRILILVLLTFSAVSSWSQTPADVALAGARLEQNIGARIPQDLRFRHETGSTVRLGDLFQGKPVIVAPVWYSCPNLCNVVLHGLVAGLKSLDFRAGEDFHVVAVSIDPRDGVKQAAALEIDLLRRYGDPGTHVGWHLLTGSEQSIRRLTDQIGFGHHYDERTGQYAHPAALMLASADGRVTRYLPGIDFPSPDLRLALLEAGRGELGSVVDQVLLRCFSYDPATGKYTLAIVNVMRVLGTMTALGIAAALAVALLRERRRRRA